MRHPHQGISACLATFANAIGGVWNASEEPMNVRSAFGAGINGYRSTGWSTGPELISNQPGYVRLEWKFILAIVDILALAEVM